MSAVVARGSGGFVVGASVVYSLRTVLRQHGLDHVNHHALARLGQRADALQLILQFRCWPALGANLGDTRPSMSLEPTLDGGLEICSPAPPPETK